MRLIQLMRHCKLGALEREIRRRIDIKGLNRVHKKECDTTHLQVITKSTLNKILSDQNTDVEWHSIRETINTFSIPDGTGGINPGDRRAVFYLIRKLLPESVLEIGTHIGASTIHIAAALVSNKLDKSGYHPNLTSIDITDVNDHNSKPWLKAGMDYSPIEMINKLYCGHFVQFVKSSSLSYFDDCTQKYDFIFLDGSHSAQMVYREIPSALRLLNNGGTILLHDYFLNLKPLWSNGNIIPGPFLAIERLKYEGNNLTVLPLGSLPWPTKLKSNITSLALLTKTDIQSGNSRSL